MTPKVLILLMITTAIFFSGNCYAGCYKTFYQVIQRADSGGWCSFFEDWYADDANHTLSYRNHRRKCGDKVYYASVRQVSIYGSNYSVYNGTTFNFLHLGNGTRVSDIENIDPALINCEECDSNCQAINQGPPC